MSIRPGDVYVICHGELYLHRLTLAGRGNKGGSAKFRPSMLEAIHFLSRKEAQVIATFIDSAAITIRQVTVVE